MRGPTVLATAAVAAVAAIGAVAAGLTATATTASATASTLFASECAAFYTRPVRRHVLPCQRRHVP